MRDKTTAAILAFVLGGLGVHKFYLGRPFAGVMYLAFCLTGIPFVLALADFIILAFMDPDEFHRRYNAVLPPAPPVGMLPPGGGPYAQHGPFGAPPHFGAQPPGPMGMGPSMGYPPYVPPQPRRPGGLDPNELADRLTKLNELRISGLLTEEEFNAQKARILGEL